MSWRGIFALVRLRPALCVVLAAYGLGGAYVLAYRLLDGRAVAASSPPAGVSHLGSRLDIVGADVTRAGGVSVALDAERLTLRQTCEEAVTASWLATA